MSNEQGECEHSSAHARNVGGCPSIQPGRKPKRLLLCQHRFAEFGYPPTSRGCSKTLRSCQPSHSRDQRRSDVRRTHKKGGGSALAGTPNRNRISHSTSELGFYAHAETL